MPTAQLATSCVIAPPAPEGQKDRPQAHFPDSSEIPCRCNKSTAGPMLLEKQRLEIAQLRQTVMELNSQGPKDHTWCRHRTGPLSKAPHNRTGSHETQTDNKCYLLKPGVQALTLWGWGSGSNSQEVVTALLGGGVSHINGFQIMCCCFL